MEESWWEDDEKWDSINTGLNGQMEQQRESGLPDCKAGASDVDG
jgi:hypothetical protein